MPLNWNAQKVKDFDKIDTEGVRGVMDAIIWLSMPVGISEITEKNYRQFHKRLDIMQKLAGGGFLSGGYKDDKGKEHRRTMPITLAHVKRFIGLKTNVTKYTVAQFMKNQADCMKRDLMRRDED